MAPRLTSFEWRFFCFFVCFFQIKSSLLDVYTSIDESTFLCVCHTHLKRGIRTVGAKNLKRNIQSNAESWITDGRFSDQPDREHDNPLKPVRIHDDVDKKLDQCDRRRISANFSYPEGSISFDSFDFWRIRRYDVTTKTITIEFYII